MDTCGIVLMAAQGIMAGLFIGFTVWREIEHRNQIDALTSKIMAKNYVEFATYRTQEIQEPVPPAPKPDKERKKINDPHLGGTY